jgi:hypothetical protein
MSPKDMIKFEAKLHVGIRHDKETNLYVTYVPALNLYSQGKTKLQAKNAIEASVGAFLRVAYKNNVLEKCLSNGRAFEGVDITEQYINVYEAILEKKNYEDSYQIPAHLPYFDDALVAC